MIKFFLRHYQHIADRIVIQDCGSSDNTKGIIRSWTTGKARIDLIETEPWGLDERRRRDDAMAFCRSVKDETRWVIGLDIDEFVLGNYATALKDAEMAYCDALQTVGWTMVADGFPADDGRQIYEICQMGASGGAEKPCIVRPGGNFLWGSGKHFQELQDTRIAYPVLHLLHFRAMGLSYVKERNARNYERSVEKATAWGCAPEFPVETTLVKDNKSAVNVIQEIDGKYRKGSGYAPHLDHTKMINPEIFR